MTIAEAADTGAQTHSRATRKAVRRLIPLLMLVYFLAFVDRANVSLAKEGLAADAGVGAAAFGFGAGVFFLSYALLEVPSNLALHRVGARRWIARIAVTWGVLASLMMFTNSVLMFYILRFLLGAAEAGLYPGLMLIISQWFAQEHRARMVSFMLVASTSAFIIGGPIGGALLALDGAWGLHGWQWLFLVEGIPSVAVGVLCWRHLPDSPADARWLTDEEARSLTERASVSMAGVSHDKLRSAFTSPVVLLVAGIYFLDQMQTYGVVFFTPAIIASFEVTDPLAVGALVGVVGTGALAGVLVTPRIHRRVQHEPILIAIYIAATGLLCQAYVLASGPVVKLAFLTAAFFFIVGIQPLFWSVVMPRLGGKAAAAGFAFLNMIGLSGAFFGPYLFGLGEEITGDPGVGIKFLVATAVIGLALAWLLARRLSSEQKLRTAGDR